MSMNLAPNKPLSMLVNYLRAIRPDSVRFHALFFVLMLISGGNLLAQTTYFSRAPGGNWDAMGTWSTVGFDNATNTGTFPVAGDIVMIGGTGSTVNITGVAAACASISIADNSALNVGHGLDVSGPVTVGSGASGTLSITSTAGTKTFSGLVTINAGGVWNESATEPITFEGGITNNGTYLANNAIHNFNTNSQSLNGSFSIPRVKVLGSGVVLTNNGTLTIGFTLSGTGRLTQAAGATLNIGGTSAINNMTATAAGNTVNFTGGAQTVNDNDYHHLALSGSGAKTLQAGTTSIGGNFSLSGTVSASAVAGLTIGGAINIGAGTSFTGGAFTHSIGGNWINNGGFTSAGSTIDLSGAAQSVTGSAIVFDDLRLSGTGTKSLGVSTTISGNFSIESGAVAGLNNANTYSCNALFLGGAIQAAGTWGSTSSAATNQNDTFFSGTGLVTVTSGAFSYYSRADGNWNVNTTWSTTGFGGGPAASTPMAGDFVFIGGGRTVTVTAAHACASLAFDPGTSVTNTLTIGSGNTLTVAGDITIPQTVTSGSNILNVGAGSVTATNLSFTSTPGGAGHQMSISTGTATISNDVTGIGASSTISFSGAGLLRVGGSMFSSLNGTLSAAVGSTVEYNGSAQTVQSLPYNNLSMSGSGNKTLAATATIGGNLNVGVGTTFVVSGISLTVNGGSTINGTISISLTNGNKIFTGLVTVNGTWTNTNETVTFNGGIANNGTFTSGTGQYIFSTNSQTLSGTLSIPRVTVLGTSVVLTNNGTLTVATTLGGTGSLSQGVGAVLNIGNTSPINSLIATAAGNTVNYNRTAAQTIKSNNYHHLTLAGSGIKTLQTGTTSIGGNFTLGGTVTTTAVTGLAIGGGLSLGAGTTFSAGAFTHSIGGNWTNNGTFNGASSSINLNGGGQSVTGSSLTIDDLQLSGTGTKTLGVSTTIVDMFSIDNGAIAGLDNANTYSSNSLLLGGAIQSAGTWGSSSSAATFQNDTFFSGTGIVSVATGAFSYYSRADGNWNLNTTWSNAGFGGGPAASAPGATDFVFIGGGRTVTVTGTESCTSLSFDAGTSVTNTLTIGSGNSLTVSGGVTIPRTVTSGSNIMNVGAGSLNTPSVSFTSTPGGAGHQMNISTGTATISGDVTGIGASSTINLTGAGLLRIGGSLFSPSNGTLSAASGSTVEYNGAAQTIQALPYNNLSLSGSGTKSLAAGTTIGGNLNVGAGTTFSVAGVALTVSGSSTINGTLSITLNVGAKTFTGPVTVNGIWSNATQNVTFRGGIVNNGTFTAGTGTHNFDINSQSLTGIFDIPVVNVAIGTTLTNNTALTVNSALSGAGALSQATNAVLNIGSTSSITTITATANGNTVNYTGAAQTVHSGNYFNLNLSGSGVKTLVSGTTAIAGDFNLSGSVSTTGVTGLTIGGSVDIGTGTSFTSGAFTHNVGGNWTNNGSFVGTGSTVNLNGGNQNIVGGLSNFNNLTLSGSGTKTLQAGTTAVGGNLSIGGTASVITASGLTIGGTVSIGSGTSFNAGSFTHNVGGDWINAGTFTGVGGTVNFNGSAPQNISGFNQFNNLGINSSGVVTLLAAQELVGNLSLGATASFDAGAGLLTLISSSDTQSASIGTIQAGASFVGSITAQRFMGTEGEVNRYISPPVSGTKVSDLADDFDTKGMRWYDETVLGNISNGYKTIFLNESFVTGRGYLAYMWPPFDNVDVTWDLTGPLTPAQNQGSVNLNVTHTPSTPPRADADGWNLVGNPYPSGIVWDNGAGWTKSNIAPIVYVPDIGSNVFRTWNANTATGDLPGGVVALGQAFWVYANVPGASLIVHEQAKTASSGEFFRRRSDEMSTVGLTISLKHNGIVDNSYLLLRKDATEEFDLAFDGLKLEGKIAIATLDDQDRRLVSNATNRIPDRIPLYVKGEVDGEYEITVSALGNFEGFGGLYLHDSHAGTAVNISQNPSYSFSNSGSVEGEAERFYLSFSEVAQSETGAYAVKLYPNPVEDLLTVEIAGDAVESVLLLDYMGREVAQFEMKTLSGVSKGVMDMRDKSGGLYFVKSKANGKTRVERIIKK